MNLQQSYALLSVLTETGVEVDDEAGKEAFPELCLSELLASGIQKILGVEVFVNRKTYRPPQIQIAAKRIEETPVENKGQIGPGTARIADLDAPVLIFHGFGRIHFNAEHPIVVGGVMNGQPSLNFVAELIITAVCG